MCKRSISVGGCSGNVSFTASLIFLLFLGMAIPNVRVWRPVFACSFTGSAFPL